MNQILSTGLNQKKPTDIKKIVKFFAIAIILFGLVFLGQGIYRLYNNNKQEKQKMQVQTIPQISISQDERKLKVSITHDKVIATMQYSWNDGEITEIEGNNRISFNEEIDIPIGTNTLNLKVTDINGNENTYTQEYIIEDELNIDLAVVGNSIKITAEDPDGMSYLTYKWNNGEEIRVDAQESTLKIETEVEIPAGLNTLVINAVNINNIVKTKEQEIKGINPPKISAIRDGEFIIITVTDDEGLESIEHVVNQGEKTDIPLDGQTSIEYKQYVVEGDNYVTITAKSKSGAKTVFYGVCYNQ